MTGSNDLPPRNSLPRKRSGWLRGLHALKHSLDGILVTLRLESAFRQEAACATVLIPVAALMPVEPIEHIALISSVLLVLLVELLNSAIEATIDRISLEQHELSRRAKDCGSAAVMIALIICAIAWGFIGGPLLMQWLLRVL
ncbi:MAG TPA: diacylglycerol kinase [Trinickia sp.]|jgi:diacylglycerol kinase (ATP)|uniref:diacylglycerol kinase n=1 Tax=Trinickia sp. TaxID=2571163 RepID=UPI002BF11644|nr:diacylglycerol kinase [Trinickia sp.]HTI16963.1 diacylglycerol kinase [Trinickia sp.]